MIGSERKQLLGESKNLEQVVIRVLKEKGGLTDREFYETLKMEGFSFHTITGICSQLAEKGLIIREVAKGKPLVNRLPNDNISPEINGEYMEQKVMEILKCKDGLTDKEIAEELKTSGFSPTAILYLCLQLAYKGLIRREKTDNEIRNYYGNLINGDPVQIKESVAIEQLVLSVLDKDNGMTDQQIKEELGKRINYNIFVSEVCKQLAYKGMIRRVKKKGKAENFLA